MHILVIGNGFDLAHGLPTSYKDFLEFCVNVEKIFTSDNTHSPKEYWNNNIRDWLMNDTFKWTLLSAFKKRTCELIPENNILTLKVTTPDELLNELYSLIKNNTWIQYFLNHPSYIGENWIDFESEMSRVIQSLDETRFQLESGGSIDTIKSNEGRPAVAIWNASKKNFKDAFRSTNTIDKFSEYLLEELEKLIRALEIYIAKFVRSIKIDKKIAAIERIKPDYILSFNYSNTYRRIYDKNGKATYDYIHGQASKQHDKETCKLVLGIDEYLSSDRKDTDLEFLPFKKYFQRIYKQTGNKYINWANQIEDDWNSLDYTEQHRVQSEISQNHYPKYIQDIKVHQLYVFGHSLDKTDRDVLRRLILNNNVKTNIFYHRKYRNDKSDLKKKITNLIKIIGQDELIKRTGGLTRTIEFVPQEIPESLS